MASEKIKSGKESTIYKRTVYTLKARVNKNNLTKQGYFDLTKLKNLRIVNNGFLKRIRNDYNETQKDLSELMGVPLRTLLGWEYHKKAIPFNKLISLFYELNIKENYGLKLIENCYFTLGWHHGGSKVKLPLKPEMFVLSNYLIPNGLFRVYLVKTCPDDIKKYILNKFNIDKSYYQKTSLIVIYSKLLNVFLNTFYIYNKEPLLKFPLSKEVSLWRSQKIDLKKAIIIPLLLSDGGEKSNRRLFFSGASESIHKIWSDSWFYHYNLFPSSFKVRQKSIFVTTHNVTDQILVELKKHSPTFKTSPRNTSKQTYLKLPQPSIKYLFSSSKLEQRIAIRIWANTEGSIGIRLDKRDKLITPVFKIACAHPLLVRELRDLCALHNINLSITKEKKNWAGLEGLKSTSFQSTINFLKTGGFIKGTRVASQSRFFKNLDKQDVLLGILEFVLRQRKNKKYRFTNINKIYKLIRNIIIKREIKKEKYYLGKFEDFDNWSFRR